MNTEEIVRTYETWAIKTVKTANVIDAAYCIAVGYSNTTVGGGMHVSIGIGLERDRTSATAEKKVRFAKYGSWYDPAELEHYDTVLLGSPPKIDSPPPQETWRDIYVEVSRRLADRDSPERLPTTDDFVVYATDCELEDLGENFGLSVPTPLRERLLADGWIPEALALGVPMW